MESSLFTKYDVDKNRATYYYDKYKYRCKFSLRGVHFLRVVRYKASIIPRYLNNTTYVFGKKSSWKSALGTNISLIEQLCDWIAQHKDSEYKDKITISVGYNSIMLYYNDESLIDNFLRVIEQHADPKAEYKYSLKFARSTRVENFERGVIYLRRPKHKYRLYFNYTKLGADDAAYVRKYLLDIEKSSQAYNRSLYRFAHRTNFQGVGWDIIYLNSYLDVNDDVHATYLNLFKPGIIHRVAKIEQRINTVESED